MNIFNERLQRMKFSYLMAVTQRDTAPAALFTLPLPGQPAAPAGLTPGFMPGPQRPGNASWPARPFSVPGQPTTPHAPPRVLHVRAHLLRAPVTASQPDWESTTAPALTPATFPISRPVAPQQPEAWPALEAHQPDFSDPVFEAPTFAPDTLAQPTFAADSSVPTAGAPTDPLDPFGDLAEALAAGLTTAPPEQPQRSPLWTQDAPMASTPVSPEPEPVAAPPRMPSFTEAMALNGRLGAPTPTDRAVPTPAVPLPTLPEHGPAVAARAAVPQAAPPASSPVQPFQPQSPQQPRVTLEERLRAATAATEAPPALAAAVQTQPIIRPEPAPQPSAAPRSASEPIAEPVSVAPQSRPAPDDHGPPVQGATPVAEVAPVEAASRPEPVAAQSNPRVIPEEPAGAMVEPSSQIAESADDVEVAPPAAPEARTAEPTTPTIEVEPSNAAAPEEDAAQQARQVEEEQKKRQELEDLMRRMNNGVPVRLPRRPRPNVPVKAEPTEPSPPSLPEIPLEVAQNFLARLNRFAEMEQSGETSESPLLYNRLEHWEDHHPENNARIEDYLNVGTPDPPPTTPAQAVPVAEHTSPSAPVRPTPAQPMPVTNPPAGLPAAPAARLQKALEVGERHRLKAEPRTTVTSRAREGQPPSRPRTSPDADDTEGSTPASILTRTLLSAEPVVAGPHQAREEQVQHTHLLLSVPDHETGDVAPLRRVARSAPVVESPALASSSTAQFGIPALTDSAPQIQRERPAEEVLPHQMVSVASPPSPLISEPEASTSMPAAHERPVENPQVLPVESSVLPGLPLIPAVDGLHAASTSVEAPARDLFTLPAREAGTPTIPALPSPEAAAVRQAREPILPAWLETVADQSPTRQGTAIPRGSQPIEGLPSAPTFLAPQGVEAAPVVVTRQTMPLIPATPVTAPVMPDRGAPARVTAMPSESLPFESQPAVSALLAAQGAEAEAAPLLMTRQATPLSPAPSVTRTRTSVPAWHRGPEPVTPAGDQVSRAQAPLFAAPVVAKAPTHSSATLPVGLPVQRSDVLPDLVNRGAEPSPPAVTSAWTRPAQPVFSPVQRSAEQAVTAYRPDVDHVPAAIPAAQHPSDPATRLWRTSVVTPTPPMLDAPLSQATSQSFGPAAPVGLPPILPTLPSLTSPNSSVWPGKASPSGFSAERPAAFPMSVLEASPRTETSKVSLPGLPSLPGLSTLPALALPVPVQPTRPGLTQLGAHALQADGHGTPLPLGVQDALQRTLGTSVRDIRVVRNAQVPALLSAANADGLAVDRTVFLPAHVDLTTPAGHALAAHEFTHALRRTQPGFTPDVVRRAHLAAPALAREEDLAVLTEHLAHQEAHEASRAPARTSSFPLTARERRGPRDIALPRAPVMPTRPEPAPVSPAAPARTLAPAPQVHAADTNRPAPQPPTNPAPAPSKEREKDVAVGSRQSTTPQVDLDQVARDVYARLRERLGEELRRLRS